MNSNSKSRPTRVFLRLLNTAVAASTSTVVVVVCLAFGGPAASASGSSIQATTTAWPMYGRTPTHLNFNPDETILGTGNVSGLRPVWSHGSGLATLPVAAGPAVFAGAGGGEFYAMTATTGATRWSATLSVNGGGASAAVSHGILFAPDHSFLDPARLDAVEARTGARLWQAELPLGAADFSIPAVATGVVYVNTHGYITFPGGKFHNGGVFAFDESTGRLLWGFTHQRPEGTEDFAAPAVSGGIVYAAASDGSVYALNAGSGDPIWQFTTGGPIYSNPAVADGIVFFGSNDHNVYAVDAATGIQVWAFTTGGGFDASSPAVANGVVYIGSENGTFYAIDEQSGQELWHYATGASSPGALCQGPAVANGVVYFTAFDGNAYAFDARTGQKLWQFYEGGSSGPVIVVNGHVYVTTWYDGLMAFGLQ